MLRDTPLAYGFVTRLFHWTMACLIGWQFMVVLGWRVFGNGAVTETVSLLGPSHRTAGALLFALVVPRAMWAFRNRRQRPVDHGVPGTSARIVHVMIYLLTFIVPGLALARTYANGKGFDLWGLRLVPGAGTQDRMADRDGRSPARSARMGPCRAGRGPHVLMALVHTAVLRDGLLRRMIGTPQGWSPSGRTRFQGWKAPITTGSAPPWSSGSPYRPHAPDPCRSRTA